jgi:MFS transporter, UMF1 family
LGPAVFEMASRTTGSSRGAILSVVVFFLAGAAVLSLVNVQEGQGASQN